MVEFFIASEALFWVCVLNFSICELGEQVNHQFEIFGEELERCNWNNLPTELQRMYLIFLSDIQQPVNIQSYGGIICSRDTFEKVFTSIMRSLFSTTSFSLVHR